jgi:hypothetical protein
VTIVVDRLSPIDRHHLRLSILIKAPCHVFFLEFFFSSLPLPSRSLLSVCQRALRFNMLLSTLLLQLGVAAVAKATSAHHNTTSADPKLGAVASESSVCSNIGIDMLKEGGNAADAVSSIAQTNLPTKMSLYSPRI